MNLNIDDFGVITKKQDNGTLEGGDSMANEGTYHSCIIDPYAANAKFNKLEVAPGVWRRHPDISKWYGETNRTSRDQLIPILTAIAANGLSKRARKFLKQHLKRGLLFATNTRRNGATRENHGSQYKGNGRLSLTDKIILKLKIPLLPVTEGFRNHNWKLPDLTLIEFWALLIRACDFRLLYPLLMVFDISLFFGFLFRKFLKSDPDVRNYIMPLLAASYKLPTPFSMLASYLSKEHLDLAALVTEWWSSPGEPEMHKILIPTMKKQGLCK